LQISWNSKLEKSGDYYPGQQQDTVDLRAQKLPCLAITTSTALETGKYCLAGHAGTQPLAEPTV